jgi:putative redox protein
MTVSISGEYLGQLKLAMTHGPSGTVMHTVPPVDNNGDGSSFSPTDLVATGLAACMVTILCMVAERDGLDCSGIRVDVEKHMSTSPRRIGSLPVKIYLPDHFTPEQRAKLERAALTCPVHASLHPDIEKPVEFIYQPTPVLS